MPVAKRQREKTELKCLWQKGKEKEKKNWTQMHVAKKAEKDAEQKSLWLDYKESRNNTNASV